MIIFFYSFPAFCWGCSIGEGSKIFGWLIFSLNMVTLCFNTVISDYIRVKLCTVFRDYINFWAVLDQLIVNWLSTHKPMDKLTKHTDQRLSTQRMMDQ